MIIIERMCYQRKGNYIDIEDVLNFDDLEEKSCIVVDTIQDTDDCIFRTVKGPSKAYDNLTSTEIIEALLSTGNAVLKYATEEMDV